MDTGIYVEEPWTGERVLFDNMVMDYCHDHNCGKYPICQLYGQDGCLAYTKTPEEICKILGWKIID